MGYKILGYAVWHGAKLYLKRRYPVPSRRTLAAGVVVIAVLSLALGGARRASD